MESWRVLFAMSTISLTGKFTWSVGGVMGDVVSLSSRVHRLKPYMAIYWLQDVDAEYSAAVEARTTTDALKRLALHPLMMRHAPYIVKVELYQGEPNLIATHRHEQESSAVLDGKEFLSYM